MKLKKITTIGVVATTLLSSLGVTLAVKADELTDTAYRVIRGDFGNGEARKGKLAQDYARVQDKVNELLSSNSPTALEEAETHPTTQATVQPSVTSNTPAEQKVSPFSTANVLAQTQYSHTENGHVEGGYYDIPSSIPSVVETGTGKTVTGTITRSGIGLEKGTINLTYVLNFDSNGSYQSGVVTSSGYVDSSVTLSSGQNYAGQTVNFISTTGGYAGSGSYIYPITAQISLN